MFLLRFSFQLFEVLHLIKKNYLITSRVKSLYKSLPIILVSVGELRDATEVMRVSARNLEDLLTSYV